MCRVVAASNFNSETYCETFKSEPMLSGDAHELADKLNSEIHEHSDTYYVVKDADYILYDTKNPNHPYYGL